MANHDLKTDHDVFEAIRSGRKTYEIRKDDRGFAVGDTVRLLETINTGESMRAGAPLRYTQRECKRRISHILRDVTYGVQKGFAILSLAEPEH